jgi:hypothetical protein
VKYSKGRPGKLDMKNYEAAKIKTRVTKKKEHAN